MSEPSGGFRRVLGLGDVVLMNVAADVGLRSISRGARAGVPSISLWVLAWLLFFVPFAAAVMELSRRYPDPGGLYVWVRRALGPRHGFIAGWCYCLNFAFYYVTFLLFAAAGPRTFYFKLSRLEMDPVTNCFVYNAAFSILFSPSS